jgi:PLP dependent protein
MRLSAQRPAGMAPLKVCVQVRIGEESKSGAAPAEAARARAPGRRLPGLSCAA